MPQRFHGRVFALNQTIAWSTLPIGFALLAPVGHRAVRADARPRRRARRHGRRGDRHRPGPGHRLRVRAASGWCWSWSRCGGFSIRTLRRFDIEVPDALPDDLIGAQERERRLAAATSEEQGARHRGHLTG